MKLIIAGSRFQQDEWFWRVNDAVAFFDKIYIGQIDEIVSGTAHGYDRVGERIATLKEIPLTLMPADWDQFGKAAGFIRNKAMGEYADYLLAFWDGESQGTKNMIEIMEKLGKPVLVYRA